MYRRLDWREFYIGLTFTIGWISSTICVLGTSFSHILKGTTTSFDVALSFAWLLITVFASVAISALLSEK